MRLYGLEQANPFLTTVPPVAVHFEHSGSLIDVTMVANDEGLGLDVLPELDYVSEADVGGLRPVLND